MKIATAPRMAPGDMVTSPTVKPAVAVLSRPGSPLVPAPNGASVAATARNRMTDAGKARQQQPDLIDGAGTEADHGIGEPADRPFAAEDAGEEIVGELHQQVDGAADDRQPGYLTDDEDAERHVAAEREEDRGRQHQPDRHRDQPPEQGLGRRLAVLGPQRLAADAGQRPHHAADRQRGDQGDQAASGDGGRQAGADQAVQLFQQRARSGDDPDQEGEVANPADGIVGDRREPPRPLVHQDRPAQSRDIRDDEDGGGRDPGQLLGAVGQRAHRYQGGIENHGGERGRQDGGHQEPHRQRRPPEPVGRHLADRDPPGRRLQPAAGRHHQDHRQRQRTAQDGDVARVGDLDQGREVLACEIMEARRVARQVPVQIDPEAWRQDRLGPLPELFVEQRAALGGDLVAGLGGRYRQQAGALDPGVDVATLARQVGALLLDLGAFGLRIGGRPRSQLVQAGVQRRQLRRQFLRYQLGRVLDAHGIGTQVAQRGIVLSHRVDAGLYPVQIGVGGIEGVIGTGLGESGSQGDPEEAED